MAEVTYAAVIMFFCFLVCCFAVSTFVATQGENLCYGKTEAE